MIDVKELRKAFGPIQAVAGISFQAAKGDVLGFTGSWASRGRTAPASPRR